VQKSAAGRCRRIIDLRRISRSRPTVYAVPILGFGTHPARRFSVNWDEIEGNWKQAVREKWGDLTDDGLDRIAGNREQFVGRLQKRYGTARDQAERDVDAWARDLDETRFTTTTY
jgi:uncharacterized protein YjbJ (UPF0337 family)